MSEGRSKNVSRPTEVRLELRFLGAPQVLLYGEPIRFRSRKVLALLAFLAVEGGVHRREFLVDMLWPDSAGSKGSATLRSTLSRLRESLGETAEVIEADSFGVRIVLDNRDRIDVHELLQVAGAAELLLHDDLPEGRFLEGFSVDGSAEFDDWVTRWSAICQGQSIALYDRLSEQALRHGRLDAAESLASRWQELAPFDDGPMARLVEVDGRRGARASALERFDRYCETLTEELGARPGLPLRTLVDRVRDGDLANESSAEAIRRHLDAGRAALSRDDVQEAVIALDQASLLLDSIGPADATELTLPVLETRARALELCGRFEAAHDDYRRLVDRSIDHRDLAGQLRGLVGLAVLYATPTALASFEVAADHATAAIDLSRLVGDRDAEALAHWAMLLVAHYGRGDEAAALDHATRGIAAARAIVDSPVLPRLLNDLHWVQAARGDLAAARDALAEATEGWARLGDSSMLADSLNGAVLLATLGGDFEEARAVAAHGIELAGKGRNLWNQLAINANLGLLRREVGEYDVGISALRAAADVAVDAGMPAARAFYQLTLAVLLGDLGLTDRVEALCVDVEAGSTDLPRFWLVPETIATLRIRNRLQTGAIDAADLDTVAAIAAGPVGLSLTSVLAPPLACAAARRLDEPERALEIADHYLRAAERAPVRIGRAEMLLQIASAHLDLGATNDAATALRRAVGAADEIGSRRLRWQQHLVAVRLLRKVGRESDAEHEHAAHVAERVKIVANVSGPDRQTFEALIAADADRMLRSSR